MKRAALILLILSLFLTSCGSSVEKGKPYLAESKFATDDILPDYDIQQNFFNIDSYMCETEEAYYFAERDLNTVSSANFLWFYDKQSGLSGKLCAKPECTHIDRDCNACIAPSVCALSFYNGRLFCYYDSFDSNGFLSTCISLNTDGTGRKTEMVYYRDPFSASNAMSFIHRGYIYETKCEGTVVDGVASEKVVLYCWNIETGEMETLFEKYGGNYYHEIRAIPVGNDIYFVTNVYDDNSDMTFGLYRLDTGTRELETYYDGPFEYEVTGLWPEAGDGIYLNCCDYDTNKLYTGKYDFKTGEFSFLDTGLLAGSGNLLNGKLVCYSPDNISYDERERSGGVIYSLDGEKLGETATITEIDGEKIYGPGTSGNWSPWLLGYNDEYVFIKYTGSKTVGGNGSVVSQSIVYYAFPLDGSEPFEMWRCDWSQEPQIPVKD